MQNRRNFLAAIGLATGFGLASLGGAAAAADDLNWSVHVDLTGPASYGGIKQGDGFQSFVDWKNAQGGIRGRKINLTIDDSTFKVDVAAANFKKALAKGKVHYLFADSTGMVQAVTPENNSTHKVFMGGGSFSSEVADDARFPYYFVAGATYGDQLKLLVDHIAESTDPKKARLAIMHSNLSFGRDGIEGAKARATELGIEVVSIQQTKFMESDVSAFALAIRIAKPTHVITHGYSFAVWPEVIRLVRDFGMNDVIFMSTMWQNEYEKVVELADIAEGLVGIKVFNFNSKSNPGEMMDAMRKIHQDRDPNFNGYLRLGFLDGWMNAMMVTKATEDVIDAGKEVNGDNLKAAMLAVKDWDTGGLINTPVSFDGHKTGVGQIIRWEKRDDWTPVPISEWMKVD